MSKFQFILKKKTIEEALRDLKRAGILDENGKLADKYCTKKQLKEKKKQK